MKVASKELDGESHSGFASSFNAIYLLTNVLHHL